MKNIWLFIVLIILFPANTFASSIQELQDVAVKNRKIINKYKQHVEMAEKDILIAQKGYFPSVDAAYVLNALNETTPSGEHKGNSTFKGSITYNVFAGFRDKYSIKAAEQLRDADQLEVESTIQDIKHAVARSFTDIYVKKAATGVSEKTYEVYTQLYSDAMNKYNQGILNKSDLLRTKVELDNAFIDLATAKANLKMAINDLEVTINASIQPDSLDFIIFLIPPKVSSIDINQKIMLSKRSDIRMLKKYIEASNAQANVVRSSYYPSVDLSGSYRRYDDHFANGRGDYTDMYDDELRAQLTVSINLFDGMAKSSRIGKAKANSKSLQYDLYELQQKLKTRLMNYYLDFDVSERNLAVTETGIKQATENLRITKLLGEEGISRTSEILDAVENLARAEMNNISATSSLFIGYFNIKRAIENY